MISSTFTGWSVSGATTCSGTGACALTLTNTQSVTATFALNTFTITPAAGAGGVIAPNVPQTVNYGSALTFTISPNVGYSLSDVRVDGVSVGTVNTYTFTNITASHTITAAFSNIFYVISHRRCWCRWYFPRPNSQLHIPQYHCQPHHLGGVCARYFYIDRS